MIDPRVASGLRDLPPSVMIPRERMLAAFRRTFAAFGFVPIETPHIERMEVLTGKGAGSDEVLRQIFEVTNKGGTPGELALRFDLTVPLARFVAKHINELGVPFKRYAIGSVFRGERPAKGRFREFVQCDFDTIGTESPVADAETAQVIHAALAAAGVPDVHDHAQQPQDPRRVPRHARAWPGSPARCSASLDKLAKIGRDAVLGELERAAGRGRARPLGRPGSRRCSTSSRPAAAASRSLQGVESSLGSDRPSAQGIANLRTVLDLLDAAGVPRDRLAIDLGLARGLDYYTGIVFETTVKGWEKFGSVASGGRYDNLASLFTPRRLPGVGASIGLDRLLALMDEAGWLGSSTTTAPVLVAKFPGTIPTVAVRRWPRGCGPRASAPRSSPTRSRSASRWATARPRATSSR